LQQAVQGPPFSGAVNVYGGGQVGGAVVQGGSYVGGPSYGGEAAYGGQGMAPMGNQGSIAGYASSAGFQVPEYSGQIGGGFAAGGPPNGGGLGGQYLQSAPPPRGFGGRGARPRQRGFGQSQFRGGARRPSAFGASQGGAFSGLGFQSQRHRGLLGGVVKGLGSTVGSVGGTAFGLVGKIL
jgi:hypothetical protein